MADVGYKYYKRTQNGEPVYEKLPAIGFSNPNYQELDQATFIKELGERVTSLTEKQKRLMSANKNWDGNTAMRLIDPDASSAGHEAYFTGNTPSKSYISQLQSLISEANSGNNTSGYQMQNGNAVMTKSLEEQAANEAAVKAGTMKKVPLTGGGFGYVPTGSAADKLQQGLANGVSPTDPGAQHAASMSGNNVNAPGMNVIAPLPPPVAPSNASQVNQMSGINLPNGNPASGSISGAVAGTAGTATQLGIFQKIEADRADAAKAEADRISKIQEQNSGLLASLLSGKKSNAQTRDEEFAALGVDPASYFAEQKAKITEIDTLTKEYNATKAEMETAKANALGKLSTTGQINSLTAKIERDYAPKLSRMSADINSKAAVLQALQGNFAEARSFVNQAVEDATADLKFKLDTFNTFYQINQDSITRLDSQYRDALNNSINLAKEEYDTARADKTALGNLMVNNPQAGIKITDTLDEAYAKVGLKPKTSNQIIGSAETGYYNVITDASGKVISKTLITGGSGPGSGNGNLSPYINVMQQAINEGATPEEAAQAAAVASGVHGVNVNQTTLSQWVAQARNLKPVLAPVVSNTTSSAPKGSSLEYNPKTGGVEKVEVNPITGEKTFKSAESNLNINFDTLKTGKEAQKVLQNSFFSSLFLN